MYAVIDGECSVIAFHDELDICEEYRELIYHYHNINLQIVKIKKKSKFKLNDELYLVRYGQSYVQSGYLTYIQLAYGQIIDDLKFAKDILLRTLEINKLDNKDTKTIKKAIKLFDKLVFDNERYTPSITELSNLKEHYYPYMLNNGLFNDE